MRKIFLDCGANNGCSVRFFRKLYPDHREYEIYSFEASSRFNDCFEDLGVNYQNVAVWIKNGIVSFYESSDSGASTLIQDKAFWNACNGKQVNEEKVECIDIDNFIKSTFSKEDYIILKLDIEGAEYQVIEHMLKNGSMDFIKLLYIEFHNEKCNIPKYRDEQIKKELTIKNIEIREWDALGQ